MHERDADKTLKDHVEIDDNFLGGASTGRKRGIGDDLKALPRRIVDAADG